jgi:ribosome-associated protein
MPQSDPLQPDEHSKSQRKRDMLELQKMGEALIKLTAEQLKKMELPENLLSAIQQAKLLKSNEAKRRHMQYIGKIMREVDVEPIKAYLKRLRFAQEKSTEKFHQTEEWRSKLISQGDQALNSFLSEYPDVDRQQLRQLIRRAQHDKKTEKNTGAETALFKYLRGIIKE